MKAPKQVIEELNQLEIKMAAYKNALATMSWDGATFAPKNSVNDRAQAMGIIGGEAFKLTTSDELDELLKAIEENPQDYDKKAKVRAELLRRDYKRTTCIPVEEFMEFMSLQAKSSAAWEKAKEEDDFAYFAPYLKKVIGFVKSFATYFDSKTPVYDTLLDEYERGLNTIVLDEFFADLKAELVPLIRMASSSDKKENIERLYADFKSKKYDVNIQRELTGDLCDAISIDKDSCSYTQSVHPFTSGTHRTNTRFTTVYREKDLQMSVYSSLHEGGHAKYEMGLNPVDDYTCLSNGVSMAVHESQSRFYENNIGRSSEYSKTLYNLVKKRFPEQMAGYTSEDFFTIANRSTPTLIRVQADELTYCLHIMVRYEMEKLMFNSEIDVDDLPKLWNDKYEEYLGIVPPNNALGILQDVHWSEGLMGYFPSYALGSAYASQFETTMRKEMDFDGMLKSGDLTQINKWMSEKVHLIGSNKTPSQIIEDATGEPFSAKYYIDYLKRKYTKIYG